MKLVRLNPDSDKKEWEDWDDIEHYYSKTFRITKAKAGAYEGEYILLEVGGDDRKWHMDKNFLDKHFIPNEVSNWEKEL